MAQRLTRPRNVCVRRCGVRGRVDLMVHAKLGEGIATKDSVSTLSCRVEVHRESASLVLATSTS